MRQRCVAAQVSSVPVPQQQPILAAGEDARLLGRTELFAALPESALRQLANQAELRGYRAHQVVFREGEPGDRLFVLAAGTVKLEVKRAAQRMLLTTLQPPETFGELSLVQGGTRSASAVALTPCTLLTIDRSAFVALLRDEPSMAEAVLTAFGNLVRRLTAQAADLALLDLAGRVARVLVALAEKQGPADERHEAPELRLTQSELAQMTGGSRQSVNQVLGAFQARSLIELRNRTIVVRRLDLLRARNRT